MGTRYLYDAMIQYEGAGGHARRIGAVSVRDVYLDTISVRISSLTRNDHILYNHGLNCLLLMSSPPNRKTGSQAIKGSTRQ